ncbi:MAG: hypothetical protein ACU84H_16850, partial [Gammaproteobacteria bacterium]
MLSGLKIIIFQASLNLDKMVIVRRSAPADYLVRPREVAGRRAVCWRESHRAHDDRLPRPHPIAATAVT